MTATKHLYQNFLTNRRIYNLNRGYWKRMLFGVGESISQPFYNEHFSNGTLFYDGNPIISAYAPALKKSIRVIQEEPETEEVEIGAWTELTEFDGEDIQELVISLELSRESSTIAKKLIVGWLKEDWNEEQIEKAVESYS